MKHLFAVIVSSVFVLAVPDSAGAQPAGRFEIGGQVTAARSSEFDATDVGIGARLAWHPMEALGIEAEFDFYPGDFPDRNAFSRARTEGLFGVTIGPTFDRVRPFAKLRPGFIVFSEAPEAIICIAIFPPPLACTLAAGRTLLVVDIGGGVEVFATPTTFIRVDAGDRLVRYPGPSFDSSRRVRDDAFFSHDFRFAVGGGLRF
jgi:hypothetical protein